MTRPRIPVPVARSLCLLLPVLLTGGCGDGATAPAKTGDGQLVLRVYQEGLLLDRDLAVQVDRDVPVPLQDVFHVGGGWGSVMLPPGQHDVALTGLDSNCQPVTAGPAIVAIGSGTVTKLDLHVSCHGDQALGARSAAVIQYDPEGWGNSFLRLLDTAGRLSAQRLDGTSDVSWAPDGTRLAAIDDQGPMIGDKSGAVRRLTWPGASSGMLPAAIAWAPDREVIAALDLSDPARCQVFLIQGPSWNEWRPVQCGRNLNLSGYSPAGGLAWSPDGTQLLVGNGQGNLVVVSASTGLVTELPFPGFQYGVVAVAWSPAGDRVALSTECLSCTSPASAFIVTLSTLTLRPVAEWKGFPFPLTWVPDGSGLIVGTRQVELSGEVCTVNQVIPIDQPENWRPLRPCGTEQFLQIALNRGATLGSR